MKTASKENSLMQEMQHGFSNGLNRAEMAKQWLANRKLSAEVSQAGYNSGQLHQKRLRAYTEELQALGYLTPFSMPNKIGVKLFTPFGKGCIMFPLKNENGHVVNFCAIDMQSGKATFLNEEGFYPAYPDANTKKLFMVQGIIDAATLLEAKVLKEGEGLTVRGGSSSKYQSVIDSLPLLEEVIEIKTMQHGASEMLLNS